MNFSADLAKIRRSFELPTDFGRIHAFRAGNLDASLHFTPHISCDSLLIAGPAVYGLNRAIPNDRPQSPPSSLPFLRLCDQHISCTLVGPVATRLHSASPFDKSDSIDAILSLCQIIVFVPKREQHAEICRRIRKSRGLMSRREITQRHLHRSRE